MKGKKPMKSYAAGGMVSEYGGKEKYASKAAMMRHERKETPARERAEAKMTGKRK